MNNFDGLKGGWEGLKIGSFRSLKYRILVLPCDSETHEVTVSATVTMYARIIVMNREYLMWKSWPDSESLRNQSL